MSRPPLGPALIDRLDGSDAAKQRARLVLETIAGVTSVQDAASQLEVTPQRFDDLRSELLRALISEAEPKERGRPRSIPTETEQLAQARAEGAAAERARLQGDYTLAVRAAQLRVELEALGIARPKKKKRS